MISIDENLLRRFEETLDPARPEESAVPASILGYGEISTIFRIDEAPGIALKRMPLFPDRKSAESYSKLYREYCGHLREAGLTLPDDATAILEFRARPVVLYIAQQEFPAAQFGHRLIQTLQADEMQKLVKAIAGELTKVSRFNKACGSSLELAIDGQISNWVWMKEADGARLIYVDTSTPLCRREGAEQLDPELFLKSAPSFLRWIIRLFFLQGVMTRYYDPRLVLTDLAANFYKEQRPEFVPLVLDIINKTLPAALTPLTQKEIEKYYKEDKMIWVVFQRFRKWDRWLKIKLLKKRYEFILPGKIRR